MAETAVAQVRSVHERVHGIAPDGRPYSANDAHLLSWVQLTLVDSFLRAYQRYGATPLPVADADRYVAEQSVLARRIGAVTPDPPTTVVDLNDQLEGFRPELAATSAAREAVRFLLVPPMALAARGPYSMFAAAAVGLLPGYVRRALWLPRLPITESVAVPRAVRPVVRVVDWALRPPLAS
jgi:uncharacterized protein (DUF2236 family)